MEARYFVHLAVKNNRDNSVEGRRDADARPVWILRGAVRTDLRDPYSNRRKVALSRRDPATSVERIVLVRRLHIEGVVETLTTFDHQLPDAGQARNATAVFAIPDSTPMKVWLDGTDYPLNPVDALTDYGVWVEADIAAAQRGERAISAQ